MSRFGDLQAAFQRAVLLEDDGVIGNLSPGVRTTTEALLDVYKDGYVLRLIEVVGKDHELLNTYVGEDEFETMCRAYIAANPSQTPNARFYAVKFPSFLARTGPYATRKEVGELAALEKALNDAFDCVDAPVVTVEDLSDVDPEAWSRLSFSAHPSTEHLKFFTNAADIWMALKNEQPAPPVLNQSEPKHVLVSRRETTPVMRVIGDEEAMMWDEAAKGVSFGVLCEMAATYEDQDTAAQRAAQYLAGWLGHGMITGFALIDA